MTYNYECLDCGTNFDIEEEDMVVTKSSETVINGKKKYFHFVTAICPNCGCDKTVCKSNLENN